MARPSVGRRCTLLCIHVWRSTLDIVWHGFEATATTGGYLAPRGGIRLKCFRVNKGLATVSQLVEAKLDPIIQSQVIGRAIWTKEITNSRGQVSTRAVSDPECRCGAVARAPAPSSTFSGTNPLGSINGSFGGPELQVCCWRPDTFRLTRWIQSERTVECQNKREWVTVFCSY
jgi:hypothetical protein